jgi:hypothetical protein
MTFFPATAAMICVMPELITSICSVVGWTTANSGKFDDQVTGPLSIGVPN